MDGIRYALDARYIREDWVLVMVIAAFCLGLILGAVVMDTWGSKQPAVKKPRPAPVRPVVVAKGPARHRAAANAPTAVLPVVKAAHVQQRLDVRL